jgi:hypothetical protein
MIWGQAVRIQWGVTCRPRQRSRSHGHQRALPLAGLRRGVASSRPFDIPRGRYHESGARTHANALCFDLRLDSSRAASHPCHRFGGLRHHVHRQRVERPPGKGSAGTADAPVASASGSASGWVTWVDRETAVVSPCPSAKVIYQGRLGRDRRGSAGRAGHCLFLAISGYFCVGRNVESGFWGHRHGWVGLEGRVAG